MSFIREKSLTDRAAYFLLIVGIPHVAVFLHFGLIYSSSLILVLYIVSFFTLLLNQFDLERLAKFVLISGVSLVLSLYGFLLGPESSALSVFFPISALSLVLFKPDEKKSILLGIFIPVFCCFFFDFSVQTNILDIPIPLEPMPIIAQLVVHELFVITAFLYSIYFVFLFYTASFEYEKKMELSNSELSHANAIMNSVLQKQVASNTLGKDIAKKLIQQSWPKHTSFTLFPLYEQSELGSGDYLLVNQLTTDEIYFILADVAGHGLTACLMLSALKDFLDYSVDFSQSPKEVMFQINNLVCKSSIIDKQIHMVFGVLNVKNMTVMYSNAGYQDGFFITGNTVKTLAVGGLVLGMYENESYDEEVITLNPGDDLLFFSDGLSEGRNKNHEPYGIRRILSVLRTAKQHQVQDISRELFADFLRFSGKRNLQDDIVVLAIKLL